jgi:hypothetical protein
VPSGLPQLEGSSSAARGEEELEVEEWEMDLLLEADDEDPMVITRDDNEIRGWEELRVQIKDDLVKAHS